MTGGWGGGSGQSMRSHGIESVSSAKGKPNGSSQEGRLAAIRRLWDPWEERRDHHQGKGRLCLTAPRGDDAALQRRVIEVNARCPEPRTDRGSATRCRLVVDRCGLQATSCPSKVQVRRRPAGGWEDVRLSRLPSFPQAAASHLFKYFACLGFEILRQQLADFCIWFRSNPSAATTVSDTPLPGSKFPLLNC